MEAIARLGEEGATWLPVLALLYAELGMVAEASAQLESFVAGGLVRVERDRRPLHIYEGHPTFRLPFTRAK